jgi:hypothetical protein
MRDENMRAAVVGMSGDDQLLLAEGFDAAVIGLACGIRLGSPVVAYDYDACAEILMERDGMDREEAEEFLEFNTLGSHMGEKTPVFIRMLPKDGAGGI